MVLMKRNGIANHSQVDDALDMFVNLYLEVFNETPFFSKILSDESRYLIMLKLTSLAWGQDSCVTVGKIKDFAKQYALASGTRVGTIINICCLLGIITKKVNINDRREYIISPTEKAIKLVRNSFKYYKEPLTLIYPDKFENLGDDDLYIIGKMAEIGVEYYINNFRFVDEIKGSDLFSRRDGGFEILLHVLTKTNFPYSDEEEIIFYPFSRIAKDVMVSRSHVQKLFKSAEEARFLKNIQPGGKELLIYPEMKYLARSMIISMLALAAHAAENVIVNEYINNEIPQPKNTRQ